MVRPDFKKMAEEALGIHRPPNSSGDAEHNRLFESHVPDVVAALAEAYGIGLGQGSTRKSGGVEQT